MNKKYLIIGAVVVGVAALYIISQNKKNKTTTTDKKEEPKSPYEGKNIYHGKEDGTYIDGFVYIVQNGKKTPYDERTPDLNWQIALSKGAVAQAVTQEVLDSIPNS